MERARAVTEFVIMSGPEVHDYLVTIRAQLRAYLEASFPQFSFSLVSCDADGMGFVVVPVVGYANGGDGEMADPPVSTMMAIREALEAFRPVGASVH